LYLYGELTGYKVNAHELPAPPGDVRPHKRGPGQKKQGKVNIPGHGKPEEPQDSGDEYKKHQEHKRDPADGYFNPAKGMIQLSHILPPKENKPGNWSPALAQKIIKDLIL
jgi:hypothetical protein